MSLPYSMTVKRDMTHKVYVARVAELPGCSAHGKTLVQALQALEENMRVWIESCLESGTPVPEPSVTDELPSGKWLQRAPRTLHAEAVRLAADDGVSLNHFVTLLIAREAGRRSSSQFSRRAAESCKFAWRDPGEKENWTTDSMPLDGTGIDFLSGLLQVHHQNMPKGGTTYVGERYRKNWKH